MLLSRRLTTLMLCLTLLSASAVHAAGWKFATKDRGVRVLLQDVPGRRV